MAFTVFVIAATGVGLEMWVRKKGLGENPLYYLHPGGRLRLAPYVMFTGDTSIDENYEEKNYYKGNSYAASIKTNNYGFRIPFDFKIRMDHPKGENERVVILTGGSAAYGVGATSNDTTIAGQLERILNTSQKEFKYKVYPFAQGGWVAYQEFLAVDMWGRYLHPDWIIAMNGSNDGKLPYHHHMCPPGAPNNYYSMKNAIDTIFYKQYYPTLYRSIFEEKLLQYSHLYRYITGARPRIQHEEPVRNDWQQLDDSVDWYFHSLGNLLNVCPTCKYIIATQPISHFGYISAYTNGDEFKKIQSMPDHWYLYYVSRLMQETPQFIQDYPQVVAYRSMANWEQVFPNDPTALAGLPNNREEEFFNDDVHLNDAGQLSVARFFAKIILASDNNEPVEKILSSPFDEAYASAATGNIALLRSYLDHGLSVNTTGKDQNSLLQIAAFNGHKEVVAFLLSRKPLVDYSSNGHTALSYAELQGHKEIADMIRQYKGEFLSTP